MNVGIICANINSIDIVQGIPRQNTHYIFHYYTENNLPFPLPNLNARMRSKYIKIMMHRFLPEYDAYIWIDGKVEVLTNNFVELMIKDLPGNDVSIFRHKERATAVEEIEYIESGMKEGGKYLLSRYGNQQMEKEKEFLMGGPKGTLYETTLFSRHNNHKCNYMFEEWWRRCVEFSYFDQAMFSYVKRGLKVHELSREDFKHVFKINKHVL